MTTNTTVGFSGFILTMLAIVIISPACGGKKVPDLDAIFAQAKLRTGKRPVIIIPGILGSELVNKDTDERVWINLSESKTDGLALPVSVDFSKNRDNLVASRIIERAKVSSFLPEVSIYEALINSMERYGGYTRGDWDKPDVSNRGLDKFYVFAYDWRLDNVENARLLVRKIDALKEKVGDKTLRFNVIAHSMGGLIARYAAMYGDADLPSGGQKPVPNWAGSAVFNKIFMFGTPNEGSMETLELMLKGYKIGGFDLNVLNREVAITSPAVFQLLPHQVSARFYDEELKPLDLDLYDPATWTKYGWSAFADPAFRSRLESSDETKKGDFAGVSLAQFDEFFAKTLARTKQFHDALGADSAVPVTVTFFAFGSDCDQTQDGVILYKNPKTKAWQTIFSPRSYKTASGRKVSRDEVKAKLFAPGDMRVTRRSLLAETVIEQNYRNSIFRRNLPVSSSFFCESHDQLPNSKIMQNNFITALIAELTL